MILKPISEAEVRKIFNKPELSAHMRYYMHGYNNAVRKAETICKECFIICEYCGTSNKHESKYCKNCKIEL